MSEYIFDSFVDLREIDFSKSIIWVFYADKIPPHIGFSTKNVFFSLKVSGKDENLNAEQVLELIHRKKIPSLLIQTSFQTTIDKLKSVYAMYQKADSNTTCLNPIKDLLKQSESQQLSTLLSKITTEITKIAGCYLPENYNALPTYSLEDIHSYIQQLSNEISK